LGLALDHCCLGVGWITRTAAFALEVGVELLLSWVLAMDYRYLKPDHSVHPFSNLPLTYSSHLRLASPTCSAVHIQSLPQVRNSMISFLEKKKKQRA